MATHVTVYHAPGWASCRAAMTFLQDHGIAFEEKDIVANPQYMEELLAKTDGVRGTPVIIIDGEVYRGFDRGKIERALSIGK